MGFNTLTFAIFLPIAVLAANRARRPSSKRLVLLLASLIFYAAWNPPFVLLLFLSIAVDYTAGLAMGRRARHRGYWLAASVITNLGILAAFKYANLFGDAVALFGGPAGLGELDVILPIGISFYTFQSMSYSIDVYRGEREPITDFVTFATFVTFFPQLVAGPIVRANELVPQIEDPTPATPEDLRYGVVRILVGVFKKRVLADWLVTFIWPVFELPSAYPAWVCAAACLGFVIQIILDFGGYCDIGIGAARLMGFRLPENFQRPYLSRSPAEFWRRWHITLGTWLRDYLYIPLGGNRASAWRKRLNLVITLTLAGLWHGAAWTLVIWGFFYGVAVALEDWLRPHLARLPIPSRLATPLAIMATFTLHTLSLGFFRARDFSAAMVLLGKIFFDLFDDPIPGVAVLLAIPITLLVYRGACDLYDRVLAWRPRSRSAELALAATAAALTAGVLGLSGPTQNFFYFQF